MSHAAPTPRVGKPGMGMPDVRQATREVARRLWWLWLATGIAWIVASLVILQFDRASITTVAVILGLMFAVAGIENLIATAVPGSMRVIFALFGVLFLIAAVICFIDPKATFVGLADTLGFLFLVVGIWWMVRAFLEKPLNPLWWTGLIAGILMVILAFWTSGQFFIQRAYTLLVFAGIWALMQGMTNLVRAFQARQLRENV